jgi:hypothetical protein
MAKKRRGSRGPGRPRVIREWYVTPDPTELNYFERAEWIEEQADWYRTRKRNPIKRGSFKAATRDLFVRLYSKEQQTTKAFKAFTDKMDRARAKLRNRDQKDQEVIDKVLRAGSPHVSTFTRRRRTYKRKDSN